MFDVAAPINDLADGRPTDAPIRTHRPMGYCTLFVSSSTLYIGKSTEPNVLYAGGVSFFEPSGVGQRSAVSGRGPITNQKHWIPTTTNQILFSITAKGSAARGKTGDGVNSRRSACCDLFLWRLVWRAAVL
jgi:hypothetical protein